MKTDWAAALAIAATLAAAPAISLIVLSSCDMIESAGRSSSRPAWAMIWSMSDLVACRRRLSSSKLSARCGKLILASTSAWSEAA